MPIRAALFDLDGTLLSSAHVWQDVDEKFLSRRGIAVPQDYAAAVSALGFKEASVYTVQRFGLPDSPEAVAAEWHEMAFEAYAHHVQLKPGAAEYLHRIHNNGLKLAVATALFRGMAEACLQNNGVYHLFSQFFYADEMAHNKKSALFFENAVASLGYAPAECAFFEDLAPCLRAANEAGLQTWAVCDNPADFAASSAEAKHCIQSYARAPLPL